MDTPFFFKHLRLGCATSAMQTEGYPTDNNWYRWASQPGHVRDGSSPANGNRHWERFEEDADLAQ